MSAERFLELPISAPVSSSAPPLELARRALEAARADLAAVSHDDEGSCRVAVAEVEARERVVLRLEREALATARGLEMENERSGVIGLPGGES